MSKQVQGRIRREIQNNIFGAVFCAVSPESARIEWERLCEEKPK